MITFGESKEKGHRGSVAHPRKWNQLVFLQPTLLAFALLVEESTTTITAIGFFIFHLAGIAHGPGRKIPTQHVASTLGAMRLITGVVLASVVAPALTEGFPTGFAFQMVMPIDDENTERVPVALITGCHLSGDHLLIVSDDLDIDEFHCGDSV